MAKYTKKWDKEFTKKYSNAIKELQSLENEYKQMVVDNPDAWISLYPEESQIEFGTCDGFYVSHSKQGEYEDKPNEHINVTLRSENAMFSFDFESFDKIIEFRDDVIKAVDKFQRPVETKVLLTDECEDEEGWEDNEEQEYTIQCSRTCVESWTHTVMARSTCEAYRKVQEDGEGHDENNDYNDYGDIDYESI
jgi:hypothetical protein